MTFTDPLITTHGHCLTKNYHQAKPVRIRHLVKTMMNGQSQCKIACPEVYAWKVDAARLAVRSACTSGVCLDDSDDDVFAPAISREAWLDIFICLQLFAAVCRCSPQGSPIATWQRCAKTVEAG